MLLLVPKLFQPRRNFRIFIVVCLLGVVSQTQMRLGLSKTTRKVLIVLNGQGGDENRRE